MNCDLVNDFDTRLFDSKLTENAKKIFAHLDFLLKSEGKNSRLLEAMRYSLLSGGKCLRSFFMIEAGRAFGVDEALLLTPASCLEIIHSYSLIHDDLPAMDDDDLRRGKPSCHIQFDEATAILAGDALLTIAFEILSSNDNGIEDSKKLSMINVIAKSIGHLGMAGGQMLDMIFEKENPSIAEILKMQRMKTAYLFAAAGANSAIMAELGSHQYEALVSYSFCMGLVFQIVDDLLDEDGTASQLGKKTGKDAKRGKASLHSLMGMEEARRVAKFISAWGLKKLKENDIEKDIFTDISEFLLNRKC
jgi:farnesyl diphosphate synthase